MEEHVTKIYMASMCKSGSRVLNPGKNFKSYIAVPNRNVVI